MKETQLYSPTPSNLFGLELSDNDRVYHSARDEDIEEEFPSEDCASQQELIHDIFQIETPGPVPGERVLEPDPCAYVESEQPLIGASFPNLNVPSFDIELTGFMAGAKGGDETTQTDAPGDPENIVQNGRSGLVDFEVSPKTAASDSESGFPENPGIDLSYFLSNDTFSRSSLSRYNVPEKEFNGNLEQSVYEQEECEWNGMDTSNLRTQKGGEPQNREMALDAGTSDNPTGLVQNKSFQDLVPVQTLVEEESVPVILDALGDATEAKSAPNFSNLANPFGLEPVSEPSECMNGYLIPCSEPEVENRDVNITASEKEIQSISTSTRCIGEADNSILKERDEGIPQMNCVGEEFPSDKSYEDRVFVCPYPRCRKTFRERYRLQNHKRVHTHETPFKCTLEGCDRAFRWRSSLVSHFEAHVRKGELAEGDFIVPKISKKNITHPGRRSMRAVEKFDGDSVIPSSETLGNPSGETMVTSRQGVWRRGRGRGRSRGRGRGWIASGRGNEGNRNSRYSRNEFIQLTSAMHRARSREYPGNEGSNYGMDVASQQAHVQRLVKPTSPDEEVDVQWLFSPPPEGGLNEALEIRDEVLDFDEEE